MQGSVDAGVAQGRLRHETGLRCGGTQPPSMGLMQSLLLLDLGELKPCRCNPLKCNWLASSLCWIRFH